MMSLTLTFAITFGFTFLLLAAIMLRSRNAER